jgi:DNA-binding XRE family transcriptional regulator
LISKLIWRNNLKISSNSHLCIPDWLISFEKEVAGELFMASNTGDVIRDYRMRYNMSQEGLGELMDLRRESISRIENGSVTPTLNFIKTFIKAAAVIEAVRVERAQHKEIDMHFLGNISKELGFTKENLAFLLKIAVESYDKKLMKIQKSLKENKDDR